MNYVIVENVSILALAARINEYDRLGWKPQGGVTAVRMTVSGPPIFYQAVWKEGNGASPQIQPHKKAKKGRPRKGKEKPAQVSP